MEEHAVATPRPPVGIPRWLASSAHFRLVLVDGDRVRVPFREHHARRIGSCTTACGIAAHYWHNFYDRAYVVAGPGSCASCDAALRASWAGGR
jgi:hypothetical protein